MRQLSSIIAYAVAIAASAQVPNYVPTNGLVAWWPFSGNANDASGNGNHGTSNNAVLTADRDGNANSAYGFNGLDQFIQGSINGLTNTASTTLCGWLRYTGNAGGQPYDLYFQLGQYGTHTFAYGYEYAGQNLNLYSFCTSVPALPSIDINNAWHHVAIVDSEAGSAIYVDGQVLVSSNGGPVGNCYQGSELFFIGGGADNQFVTGDLDDFGFWDRALTPTEIEALYTGQPLAPCVSAAITSFSGLNTTYQTTDTPSELIGSPGGGVFFGPGVSGTEFNPASSGPGTHTVVYTYVDQDGCVTSTGLCTTVSLGIGINDPEGMLDGVRVYPNPTDGIFSLELQLEGIVSITVQDSRGRQVLNQTFLAQGSKTPRVIDLSQEAAGAYMLRIGTEAGTASQQLVKR